ncbi:MAG TPA: hypothetical protein DEP53_02160 [Bacteroidetes bacterium]|nr:MAG: hypothetical protein A2X66_05475 [Ignavibacteria bacterium GWA2_54_16]HCA78516.1 hypothetical protein [Bacteroidota bacterium]
MKLETQFPARDGRFPIDNKDGACKMTRGVVALLAVLASLGSSAAGQVPVPANGCYHSAFTPNYQAGGAYGHDDFEALAQKKIAIEMFYTGWPANRTPDFPKTQCDAIVQKDAIPHVTWEPWVNGYPFPLDGIISGTYDSYIIGYANAVKSWAKPLFIRVGHEMNGDWYPWGGKNNGGGTLGGFGDPAKADGPERFIASFRRVRRLFDSVGVTNVSWIWCPNNGSAPAEPWNQPENFYPGDDVVDWIGLDGYNWGTSQTWSGWVSFYDTFKDIYSKFTSLSKPMMIGEFASAEVGGDKGKWIRDAYLFNKLIFPRVKAITWFNINKETDWRINSTGSALSGYQAAISDPYYLSDIVTTTVENESGELPGGFRVDEAYPNPFNGSVIIPFVAPRGRQVQIQIMDVLGQEITSAAMQGQGAISYYRWDGTGAPGRSVASGLYLAIFRTPTVTNTKKLLYIK